MSPTAHVGVGPQWVVLFGGDYKTFGCEDLLEEVSPSAGVGTLRMNSLTQL